MLADRLREILGRHGRVPLDELGPLVDEVAGLFEPVGWLRTEMVPGRVSNVEVTEYRSYRPVEDDGAEWVTLYRVREDG